MTTKSRQLATKQTGGVPAVSNVVLFDTGATGLENVSAKDLLIPRLTILQALSPQLQKTKPEFIKDAKAGDFCDTGTKTIFKEGLLLLPCFFARVFLEWAPNRKGMVKNWGTDDSIVARCARTEDNQLITPGGNILQETATWFCLNLSANRRRSFVSMSSTQMRASRRWMTLITSERLQREDGSEFTPPIYYRCWEAKAQEQSNAQGSWFGWDIEPGPTVLDFDPSQSTLKEAISFYEQARAGLVAGDVSQAAEEEVNHNSAAM